MSSGTLILRRFNGEEEFSIRTALISYHYNGEDGQYVISFEIETGGPLKTLPDTVSLQAQPSFELNLRANKIPQLLLAPGRTFKIPHGDDKNTGEYLTSFCYVEHEPTDNNEISVLSRQNLLFRIRISATTQDVNFYDGSKPLTHILLEADFTLRLN